MNLFLFGVSSDVLTKAGMNTVMGIAIVFAMLIIISFIISLFTLFKYLEKPGDGKSAAPKMTSVVSSTASGADLSDDLELVAVISAAIYAYEAAQGNEVPAGSLVVRSIRKSNKNKWQKA